MFKAPHLLGLAVIGYLGYYLGKKAGVAASVSPAGQNAIAAGSQVPTVQTPGSNIGNLAP